MDELIPDCVQCQFHFSQVAQESRCGIGVSAQGHLDVKGMAMQAPVLERAGAKIMGGIEAEFLREFDHGAGLWTARTSGVKRRAGRSWRALRPAAAPARPSI